MDKPQLNVFIADEDKVMTNALKDDLTKRFGSNINISVFNDGNDCLDNIDENTHLVILAYDFNKKQSAENGAEILKSIKRSYPEIQVVMHSSNDDISVILKSFQSGANSYIIKKENSFSQIIYIIKKRFSEPIKIFIKEFGVNKFVTIFTLTFIIMGIIVFCFLKFYPK